MGKKILCFMKSLRSSVEDICSRIVDGGFVSFASYMLLTREFPPPNEQFISDSEQLQMVIVHNQIFCEV